METNAFHTMWLSAIRPTAGPQSRPSPSLDLVPGKGGKSVAVVRISGVMSKGGTYYGGASTNQIRRDVRSAAADPNVSGILLLVDSPGGSVSGTEALAADVKAARRMKPVWAHAEDFMASAAYWVASQADAVYASGPTTLVGSIGTIIAVPDMSGMAEKAGVKIHLFTTGPLKGTGVPGTAVTDEQAADLQGLVNQVQTSFDSAVRTGRGISAAELNAVKSGGVFTAPEAKSLKLIDGIRSVDATLTELAKAK